MPGIIKTVYQRTPQGNQPVYFPTKAEIVTDNTGRDLPGLLSEKADRVIDASEGNIASFDAAGNLTDSNLSFTDVTVDPSLGRIQYITRADYEFLEMMVMGQ